MAYPRFMPGAVMVQIAKHDMENVDNRDRCSAIGGTTRMLYHHMYCKDAFGLDFESAGSEFDPRRGHYMWG